MNFSSVTFPAGGAGSPVSSSPQSSTSTSMIAMEDEEVRRSSVTLPQAWDSAPASPSHRSPPAPLPETFASTGLAADTTGTGEGAATQTLAASLFAALTSTQAQSVNTPDQARAQQFLTLLTEVT